MDTDKIISLVLGAIGTVTGAISLIWHIVRSRHDRCEFRLSELKVTYFRVPPGWTYNFIGKHASTAEPAPVGTWIHFSGRLINKGYQPGSVERIRVLLGSIPDEGERAFPDGDLRMPIHVEAHSSRDVGFRYHVSPDHTAIERLPEKVRCVIVLEDQAERQHKCSFLAERGETSRFSVSRRSH